MQEEQRIFLEESERAAKLVAQLQQKLADSAFVKEKLARQQTELEELRSANQTKDRIIEDYDSKYEKMEEQLQTLLRTSKFAKDKLAALEARLAATVSELTLARRENEALLLGRGREAAAAGQERVELIKTISVLEMQISYIAKEKRALETATKVPSKPPHVERTKSMAKMYLPMAGHDEGTQTESEPTPVSGKDPQKELSEKLAQCESRLRCMAERGSNITKEKERVAKLGELEQRAKTLELKVTALEGENTELKRRREVALRELTRLEAKKGKDVAPEFLRGMRKELEGIYRDFVANAFREENEADHGKAEEKVRNSIERKLNRMMESLADRCDDPMKTGGGYLVARLRRAESKGGPSATTNLSLSTISTPAKSPRQELERKRTFSKQLATEAGSAEEVQIVASK